MDEEFTTESNCPVCSAWPDKDKDWKRSQLDRIPLHDPICKSCFLAFWSGISGLPFTEEDLDEALRLEEGKARTVELRPRICTEPPRKH